MIEFSFVVVGNSFSELDEQAHKKAREFWGSRTFMVTSVRVWPNSGLSGGGYRAEVSTQMIVEARL